MNSEERRTKILIDIEKNKHMSIDELCSIYNVNEQIIYRDLLYLEKINKIKRTSKGAIFPESKAKKNALNLLFRETLFYKEKEAIAKFASTLIKDGESFMVDGGSTTLLFATHLLDKKKLMAITNTSTIGNIIKKSKKNTVILTGGELFKNTYATTGEIAENVISQLKVNKAIIGVCAIDVENGSFYTDFEEEAKIKRSMIEAANEIIILADSSKTKIQKPHLVCDKNTDKKITLITDKNINSLDQNKLEKNNIKVITV
ncbi:MAG: DeoR/GlpR family DNA-binding transcription regulator [Pleomorphochaeta sp.]